ncbi:acyl-CoA N-acyltransferase, partial [Aureobasidium melanogenum]
MSSNDSSDSLFPHSLIPSSLSSSLPSGYTLRPLHRSDYSHGFLTCLTDLTWIGSITEAAFQERFDWMATKGKDWYYCIVIDDGSRIVATATMIVERKFIHDFTMVAHVEEVCVSASEQGKGLGLTVIQALNAIAKDLGVGKLILNCSEKNIKFYEKCGYSIAGQQMELKYSN